MKVQIARTATATLADTDLVDLAIFAWGSELPAEVRMTLTTEVFGKPDSITWHMSRELLDAALVRPGHTFGIGDVKVCCEDDTLLFDLASSNGKSHRLIVHMPPVRNFLIETWMVAPAKDSAPADVVDDIIAQILGESA